MTRHSTNSTSLSALPRVGAHVIAATALLVAATACGDDDSAATTPSAKPTAAEPTTPAPTRTVQITAYEFKPTMIPTKSPTTMKTAPSDGEGAGSAAPNSTAPTARPSAAKTPTDDVADPVGTAPTGMRWTDVDRLRLALRIGRVDAKLDGAIKTRTARAPILDQLDPVLDLDKGDRVEGDPDDIEIPAPVRTRMDTLDLAKIQLVAKLCLNAEGTPRDVSIVESSGYDRADAFIVSELETWRYEPYEVRGKAVPFCEEIGFRFRVDQDESKEL